MPSRPLVLIAASVRSPSRIVVDGELDQHLWTVEFDGRDLAHLESRNLNGRIVHQSAGLREIGRVLLALVEERQLVVLHRDQHDRRGQASPMAPMTKRIAFREWLHLGAHLPVSVPRP